MTLSSQIRNFIIEDLQFPGSPDTLTDDYPLLEREILDSMGIFQMVSFLEGEFGIEIDDEDLLPENFETIEAIARLVDTKRGG